MRTFRASRTDGPHASIGRALRAVTFARDMSGHGIAGCDWLARHLRTGRPTFLEVKNPKLPPSARKLTPNELAMRAMFPDDYHVVLTEEDALRAVGALGYESHGAAVR